MGCRGRQSSHKIKDSQIIILCLILAAILLEYFISNIFFILSSSMFTSSTMSWYRCNVQVYLQVFLQQHNFCTLSLCLYSTGPDLEPRRKLKNDQQMATNMKNIWIDLSFQWFNFYLLWSPFTFLIHNLLPHRSWFIIYSVSLWFEWLKNSSPK